MLGRLLCWLGLHQPVVTVPGIPRPGGPFSGSFYTSALGFCARDNCHKPYQWDH